MSVPSAWPQGLDLFGTRLVIEPSPGQLSSDAGLLPLRPFDQRFGLTQAFADALDDCRDPSSWPHLGWYLRMCERLGNPCPTPVADPSG